MSTFVNNMFDFTSGYYEDHGYTLRVDIEVAVRAEDLEVIYGS